MKYIYIIEVYFSIISQREIDQKLRYISEEIYTCSNSSWKIKGSNNVLHVQRNLLVDLVMHYLYRHCNEHISKCT